MGKCNFRARAQRATNDEQRAVTAPINSPMRGRPVMTQNRVTFSFTNNRAGTLTTFFGVCYRCCILLVCLFVVFFNFLQCFFFFCFCIFFLLVLILLGSLFRFFSPPFCLLVYFILFWLLFVLSFVLFCFVFGFVSCFLSFRASSPRIFVLLLVCVLFFAFYICTLVFF